MPSKTLKIINSRKITFITARLSFLAFFFKPLFDGAVVILIDVILVVVFRRGIYAPLGHFLSRDLLVPVEFAYSKRLWDNPHDHDADKP